MSRSKPVHLFGKLRLRTQNGLPASRSGFALIMALGLMSLIVLLLLALSALLNVESAAARQTLVQALARQNATAGLAEALGIVQAKLGPDRVVTARGDLFGNNVTHPLWTGVWDVTKSGSSPEWLVSGRYSDNAKLLQASATSSSKFTDEVVIQKAISTAASYKSSHNDHDGEVIVGRMPITTYDQFGGGYAWWVSDEGVKASIGVTPSLVMDETSKAADSTVDETEMRHARQYFKGANLEDSALALLNGGSYNGSSLESQWSAEGTENKLYWLDRVSDVRSLNAIDNTLFPNPSSTSSAGVEWLSSDFTPLSRGVLANPAAAEGSPSLKVDLSTGLINDWITPSGATSTISQLRNRFPSMPTAETQTRWDGFAPALSAYLNLWRIAEPARDVSVEGLLSQVPLIAPVYYSGGSQPGITSVPNPTQGTPIFGTAPVLSELYFTFACYPYDQDDCLRRLANGTRDPTVCRSGTGNQKSSFCTNSAHIQDIITPSDPLAATFNVTNIYRPIEFRVFGFSEYWNPYTADVEPPQVGILQIRITGMPKVKVSYWTTSSPNNRAEDKDWRPFTSVAPYGSYFSYDESDELDFQEGLKAPSPLNDYVVVDLRLPTELITFGAGETLPWSGLASDAPGYKSNSGNYNQMSRTSYPGYRNAAAYGIREQRTKTYNNDGSPRSSVPIPNFHTEGLLRQMTFYPDEARCPWLPRINGLFSGTKNTRHNTNYHNFRFGFKTTVTEPLEVSLYWVPTSRSGTPNDRNGVFLSSYKMTVPDLDIGPTEVDGADFSRLACYSLYGRFGWYFLRQDIFTDSGWLTKDTSRSPNDLIQDVDQFVHYKDGPQGVRVNQNELNQVNDYAPLFLLDKMSGKTIDSSSINWNTIKKVMTQSGNNGRTREGYFTLPTRDLGASAPLIELPIRRPVSLGSLQHLTLAERRPFSIGNSWGFNAGPSARQDVNELFDDFALSGLDTTDLNTLSLSYPMLNRTLEPIWNPSDSTESQPTNVDCSNIFGYFLTKGAFNVNSTSKIAWKAMLSGIWAEQWDYADLTVNGTKLDASSGKLPSLKRAHFRYGIAGDETFVAPDYQNPDPANYNSKDASILPNHFRRGLRTVTPAQIDQMAESIVTQLQERGQPFTSMADFLAPKGRSSGAKSILEQAIIDANVNTTGSWDVEGAGQANPTEGSSVYLTQADLMTSLAPVLQVRSDTFKIRAYGDVRDPSGAVEASAICEAIVQRVPETAKDDAGEAEKRELLKDPGEQGRKFKIISLRWVNE